MSDQKLVIVIIVTTVLFLSCSGKVDSSLNDSTNQVGVNQSISNNSAWEKVDVVDEFGDIKKNEFAIIGKFNGKFSNSIATDAELIVKMQVADSSIFTMFYEYGREPKAELPNNKFVNIKVKLNNGVIKELNMFLMDNLMTDGNKKTGLSNLIRTERKPFKVIVDLKNVLDGGFKYDGEHKDKSYVFEIDPRGFNEIVKGN
jgi:hypothetical protein